jgi:hypothetical protein
MVIDLLSGSRIWRICAKIWKAGLENQSNVTNFDWKEAAKSAALDFANSNIRYNKQMTDEDKLVYGIRPA